MSNKINVVFFAAGALFGAAAAWVTAKKKYEALAQEEIDSYKQAVREQGVSVVTEATEEPQPKQDDQKPVKSVRDYAKVLSDEGYVNYGEHYVNPEERMLDEEDSAAPPEAMPYVISPDEFGSDDAYDQITLLYFDDGVVADSDTMEELTDEEIELRVGLESLHHFGEYEEDSVKVRNERLRTDFEILQDARLYSKVAARRAKRVEV